MLAIATVCAECPGDGRRRRSKKKVGEKEDARRMGSVRWQMRARKKGGNGRKWKRDDRVRKTSAVW